jgi:hypothetical protein
MVRNPWRVWYKKSPGVPRLLVLIFVFVEEEIILGRIIRPNLFDGLIRLSVIFELLEIFHYFQWSAGADGVVNKLILGRWPGCVLQIGC